MVISGTAVIAIGCSGIAIMIVTPKLRRGAQRINRYIKSVKKKNRYKKFLNQQRL